MKCNAILRAWFSILFLLNALVSRENRRIDMRIVRLFRSTSGAMMSCDFGLSSILRFWMPALSAGKFISHGSWKRSRLRTS